MRHILSLILVFAAVPAAAQTLPKSSGNPLEEICTGFMDQSGQGISGDRNKLCTCLVRETQSRLTRGEMEAYAKASEAGQQPPPQVMEKVVGIATMCLTDAAR
jgi:hypothetical protein